MKKFNKIDTLSKLVKEGFNIETLLKFDDRQLQALSSKVLGEQTTTQSTTTTYDLKNPGQKESFIEKVTSDVDNAGNVEIDTTGDTAKVTEMSEEKELTKFNEPIQTYIKGGKEVQVLEDGELDEEIMDMGAGDFDDTSFYNPYAGGFDDSQGPMDSYYSTDNKGRFVRSGMKGDAGRYSKNADYLDTPSFNNPDARGFDSDGPTDSYGGNGWDEGGFAGEMNEFAPEPKYSFMNPVAKGHQSDGPRGHSSGLHEDDELDNIGKIEKDKAGYDTDQDAPQKGPGNSDNANDGMGMFERYLTKKQLLEVAVSKKQYNFYQLVRDCKKSKYKKCGDGRNDNAVRKAANEMTMKQIEDFTSTPNPENLPLEKNEQRITEQWLLNLVEKYERPYMTKSQFLKTLNEIAVKTKDVEMVDNDVEVIDNDVEDAKYELPSWLDFDSLFVNTTTKPAPTKTPTPTKKPGRKSPYKPKHRPKPKARK